MGYNLVYQGEDKIIVQNVSYLESVWFNLLSDANRAAWMDRWVTKPPMDIQLNKWTPYMPTSFQEKRATAQRVYAWSQIYGFYRYHLDPVLDPLDITNPTVTMSNFQPTTNSLPVDYAIDPPIGGAIHFAVWIANYALLGPGNNKRAKSSTNGLGRNALRPMCFMTLNSSGGTLDAINCFKLRAGKDPDFAASATGALINGNNELVPSLDLLTEVVAFA
jgi:hypothetical protein